MGIKNVEFDADFESVEKAAKKFMRKKLSTKTVINENVTVKRSF